MNGLDGSLTLKLLACFDLDGSLHTLRTGVGKVDESLPSACHRSEVGDVVIEKRFETPENFQAYSYGHLPVITGYKWDYTFYKWSYKYL